MIDPEGFKSLKLSSYVQSDEVVSLTDWHLERRIWVGEGFGFSGFLAT